MNSQPQLVPASEYHELRLGNPGRNLAAIATRRALSYNFEFETECLEPKLLKITSKTKAKSIQDLFYRASQNDHDISTDVDQTERYIRYKLVLKEKAILLGHFFYNSYYLKDDGTSLSALVANSNFQTFISELLINDLVYGFVRTADRLRICRLVLTDNPRSLRLEVSPAVSTFDELPHLAGLIKKLAQCDSWLNFSYGFPAAPQQSAEPPLYSTGSSIVIPGNVRWWRRNGLQSRQFRITFTDLFYKLVTGTNYLTGTVHTSGPGLQQSPAIIKVAPLDDERALELLDREAAVYEFLSARQVRFVPAFILFGSILGTHQVLCLAPCGKSLDQVDSERVAKLKPKLRRCLEELHDCQLLHGDIQLRNFFVDEEENVKIANFVNSILFKQLHSMTRAQEIRQLEMLCAQPL